MHLDNLSLAYRSAQGSSITPQKLVIGDVKPLRMLMAARNRCDSNEVGRLRRDRVRSGFQAKG
jgi:hypothetical protein